jgi:hypothetical protein
LSAESEAQPGPAPAPALAAQALPFTHWPGRRERHLIRRHGNPLFGWPPPEVAPEALLEAQRLDHEDLLAFRDGFRVLVQRAIDLPPDAGSDLVLGLKADLERAYEQSLGLPEDQSRERAALGRLIDLVAKAVARAAGNDALALRELAEEGEARAIHFRLIAAPLAADLLHPDCPILPEELAPALLGATAPELAAALGIFDPAQLLELAGQATRLLVGLEALGLHLPQARGRLELLVRRAGEGRGV